VANGLPTSPKMGESHKLQRFNKLKFSKLQKKWANSELSVNNSQLVATGSADDSVGIFASSAFRVGEGSTLLSENNEAGLIILGTSRLLTTNDTTLTLRNSTSTGLGVNDTSNAFLSGALLIENSGGDGMVVIDASSVNFGSVGSTQILNSGGPNGGLLIARALAVFVGDTSSMTVSGNTNGHGLAVVDNSTLRVVSAVVSDNNANNGLSVAQNSVVRVQGTLAQMQLRNNTGRGVLLTRSSVGIFENGTTVSNNGGIGVDVDDGSSVTMSGATISGNGAGAGPDISASFGSRLTLNGNTIGILPITCDGSVLSRGDVLCP